MRRLIATAAVLLFMGACKKSTSTALEAGASVDAGPPTPHLPGPFSGVRIGMSEAALTALFPTVEDLHKCTVHLVGDDQAKGTQVPGAEKKPRSECLRGMYGVQVAGTPDEEIKALVDSGVFENVPKAYMGAAGDAVGLIIAQVRGAVRAGAVPEADIVAVGHGSTAYGSLAPVAAALFGGATKFAKLRQTRRELAAMMLTDCSDLDPERVRKYVAGEYSLAQLDADMRARVEYGRCRGPYVQHEHELQWRFMQMTGAFGAVGLARASQTSRAVDPNTPSTYAVYSQRTGLDAGTAKLGVKLANALKDTEAYWDGAIALDPGSDTKDSTWGSAAVWLRDGRVARVVVNFVSDAKLGDLPKLLAGVYGTPGTTTAAISTWALPGGVTARLDIGAAAELLIEDAKAMASPKPVANDPDASAPAATTATAISTAATTSTPISIPTTTSVAPPRPTVDPEAKSKARSECIRSCVAGCKDDAACELDCPTKKCPK